MLPKKPGMRTIVARCVNLKTKTDKARMMVLRLLRKARFSVGFGCSRRLLQAAARRKTPAESIPTMTPEFNQSSRSP